MAKCEALGEMARTTPVGRKCGYPDARNMRTADLWFASVDAPHGLTGYGDELVGLDVTSEAFKGSHFAVMPTALVEPFILAGTSAKGCCPRCGAPYRRVVARERKPTRPGKVTKCLAHSDGDTRTSEAMGWNRPQVIGNRDPQRHCTEVQTTGWQPWCKCDAG